VNTVNRLIAIKSSEEHRIIIGQGFTVIFIISLLSSIVISLFILIYNNIVNNIFPNLLIYATPYLVFILLQMMVKVIFTGQNKIKLLSIFSFLPQFLLVVYTIILVYFFEINTVL